MLLGLIGLIETTVLLFLIFLYWVVYAIPVYSPQFTGLEAELDGVFRVKQSSRRVVKCLHVAWSSLHTVLAKATPMVPVTTSFPAFMQIASLILRLRFFVNVDSVVIFILHLIFINLTICNTA